MRVLDCSEGCEGSAMFSPNTFVCSTVSLKMDCTSRFESLESNDDEEVKRANGLSPPRPDCFSDSFDNVLKSKLGLKSK